MGLHLEHSKNLNPSLFERHPVWAEYYSPEDASKMIEDGFSPEEVKKELERIEYSDTYLIPYVEYSRPSPYEFTLYKASVILNGNLALPAYLYVMNSEVNSICIYANEEYFPINLSVPEVSETEELCAALKINKLDTLKVDKSSGFEFFEQIDYR